MSIRALFILFQKLICVILPVKGTVRRNWTIRPRKRLVAGILHILYSPEKATVDFMAPLNFGEQIL